MNIILSKFSESSYRNVLKPILFMQKPDPIHGLFLNTGKILQRSLVARKIIAGMWAYQNPPYLAQTIAGISFKNPVGLSAGFDKNFELSPILKSVGFGFMEGGSLTFRQCDGNPRPWFYRLPKSKSLVVYAGLANEGVTKIISRIKEYQSETFEDFPLNMSVAKTNSPATCDETDGVADYVGSLKAIKTAGVGSMATLNISCPNAFGGEPFITPSTLEHLLTEVDKVGLKIPIFIKMPSHLAWEEFNELLDVAKKHNVTGLTISNLAKDRKKAKLADILPDSVNGNLSGKPTWELGNNLIKRTYKKYGDRFVIIGVGGIFSAENAYTKIRLGASLVELITGMIFEGPQLIGEINLGLVKLLKRDGLTNINQAIGLDA